MPLIGGVVSVNAMTSAGAVLHHHILQATVKPHMTYISVQASQHLSLLQHVAMQPG